MAILKISVGGSITLGDDILRHLGVSVGDTISAELLPDGSVVLRSHERPSSWDAIAGMLKDKASDVSLTIEEINEGIADAGAAAGMAGTSNGPLQPKR